MVAAVFVLFCFLTFRFSFFATEYLSCFNLSIKFRIGKRKGKERGIQETILQKVKKIHSIIEQFAFRMIDNEVIRYLYK